MRSFGYLCGEGDNDGFLTCTSGIAFGYDSGNDTPKV